MMIYENLKGVTPLGSKNTILFFSNILWPLCGR